MQARRSAGIGVPLACHGQAVLGFDQGRHVGELNDAMRMVALAVPDDGTCDPEPDLAPVGMTADPHAVPQPPARADGRKPFMRGIDIIGMQDRTDIAADQPPLFMPKTSGQRPVHPKQAPVGGHHRLAHAAALETEAQAFLGKFPVREVADCADIEPGSARPR